MRAIVFTLSSLAAAICVPLTISFADGFHDGRFGFYGTDDNSPTPAFAQRLPTYRLGKIAFGHGKGQLYWGNEDQQNEPCGLASTDPQHYECVESPKRAPGQAGVAVAAVRNDGDLPDLCFSRRHQAERCIYTKDGWKNYGLLMRWRLKNLVTGKDTANGYYSDRDWQGGRIDRDYPPHQKSWRHPMPLSRMPYRSGLYTVAPWEKQ